MAIPVNISETALGAAWSKVVDKKDRVRSGSLVGSAGLRAEIAWDNIGTAAMVIPPEAIDFELPMYRELWARAEGGAVGPAELHGQLSEID